ncbi:MULTISPECIES: efflux RND transporter permease subunit [Corallincola]|uniref:AcrB/AcrD/AcrF family protein n=2 Tax=Corallincola TaxID=1775176 RepID=A0A368NKJ9_9GAMM|nr:MULTISPECIES: efflux RND transporter permease subunit [Corallincola]RCU50978.1 AcrB/AcrD/AcrF family protein [Corallincola holothuriorum]TAA45932.1 efflux RND transporter permease subunit [Corallincola spongiicola]
MILTDLSVKRPVFASVISLLLIAFGLVAFDKLPLREYPNIDAPVVSVETRYRGASAVVVERRITKLIEDRISGVEGIRNISSESKDGRSSITIEFTVERDIDAAANDIRERVSRVLNNLPDEADPPEISKAGAGDDTIMWLNLVSDRMDLLELSDYAQRYLVDRFSTIDGVARIRVGGGRDYSMRIWLDRSALAARGLTVNDVEDALRSQNVELPAGSVESVDRQFTVRVQRAFNTAEQFQDLVLTQGDDGYLVRLSDVAKVELAASEERLSFRGNGVPMVGIGITKQSTANTLSVARAARAMAIEVDRTLPEGMELINSYDSSVFIEQSVKEVYQTLFIAITLVVIVIYLFLGSARAMLIPALTVPVSLMGTFIVLYLLGYTINMLTLLALILAIGMVVDDAIVMLENIHRRIELGESPLVAAFLGARQVSFAVIATTLVLISVFMPITFLEGDLGKLFTEFAVTMSAAVAFSSLVALSLSPMMCSKLLVPHEQPGWLTRQVDRALNKFRDNYISALRTSIHKPSLTLVLILAALISCAWLLKQVPGEFTPKEDRGAFFIVVSAPEGATFDYSQSYMDEVERRLMPLVERGSVKRLLIRTPRAWGQTQDFSGGFAIIVLEDWANRESAWQLMGEARSKLGDLAGIRAFPVMRQALGGGTGKPVQFVIGGSDYDELARWRDLLINEAKNNPGLIGIDHDYKETKPQLQVRIDTERAGDLGVSVETIGRTLETMLGSRIATTFQHRGEEYDVILEGNREDQSAPTDMTNIYVRSDYSKELIPLSSLVNIEEFADAGNLNRYNRMRSITIEANLADGYTLGEALSYLDELAYRVLPGDAVISYKGLSQDYQESGASIYFVFMLALIVVFLVLAAQFESYIHPIVIMLTVPLAMMGALIGLYLFGQSLNIYSQIGIIMLVGLAAKNGILIVEFANQLRDQGMNFDEALLQASGQRLRPILMTGVTTAFGALPLVLSSGAGSETRFVIGVVVLAGILIATLFTLLIVPVMYALLAQHTSSPDAISHRLEQELNKP